MPFTLGNSSTSGAYLYVDDILNGTNVITALDLWQDALPSPIMFEQVGDAKATASAVWGYSNTADEFTTSGTIGKDVDATNKVSKVIPGLL